MRAEDTIVRLQFRPTSTDPSKWPDRRGLMGEAAYLWDVSDDGRIYEAREGHMTLRECFVKCWMEDEDEVMSWCRSMEDDFPVEVQWKVWEP